jgi:hypothetical protein
VRQSEGLPGTDQAALAPLILQPFSAPFQYPALPLNVFTRLPAGENKSILKINLFT